MNRIYRLAARLLIVSMARVPFSVQAAMIGTDQIVAGVQHRDGRGQVIEFLNRDDVARQLEGMGISPSAAKARVGALTDEEVSHLAGKIDSLPAGAMDGWIWAIVIVTIVVYLVWHKR